MSRIQSKTIGHTKKEKIHNVNQKRQSTDTKIKINSDTGIVLQTF